MKRGRPALLAAALALLLLLAWTLRRGAEPPSLQGADPGQPDVPAADPADPAVPDMPAVAQETVRQAVTESGVPVRLTQRVPLPRPDPPYGPAYSALLLQAEAGEPPAQYRLGLLLYQCRDVPEDAAAVAAQVEELHQTRSRGGWDVSDPEIEEAELRRRHADCEGVPQAARIDYRRWILAAADSGLVEAQLDVMFHLPPGEYCQFLWQCTPQQREQLQALQAESLHYVSLAREAGSAAALWTFGAWYMGDEVLPPNDIEAYAHFRALDQIQAAAGQERRFGRMLSELEARLRPIDRQQAEARAAEILSNPNCCLLTR